MPVVTTKELWGVELNPDVEVLHRVPVGSRVICSDPDTAEVFSAHCGRPVLVVPRGRVYRWETWERCVVCLGETPLEPACDE